MARQVKRRTIDSPLRREQAAQTRQRILAAARQLFISRGYVATTISAIAAEAGVAVETVYASVGAKPVILATLTDQVVAGDDPAPASHRERVKRLLAEQAPAQWLGAYAREVRGIQDRWAGMYTAVRHATAADPQIAALWADKMQARLDGIRPLAAALAGRGMLAPGITADRAADVIWMLGSHENYQLLVSDRGWDPGDYQEWLTRTLEQALLPPAGTR
jgi:TetR/AcrR family transcriptional regulator of autoinduction and epiphytic fitness